MCIYRVYKNRIEIKTKYKFRIRKQFSFLAMSNMPKFELLVRNQRPLIWGVLLIYYRSARRNVFKIVRFQKIFDIIQSMGIGDVIIQISRHLKNLFCHS